MTTAGKDGSPDIEQVAARQRKIQQETDRRDASKPAEPEQEGAVQAGDRKQPELPLPQQHLIKPGLESDLKPRPQFEAPGYKGSGKLADMAVLSGDLTTVDPEEIASLQVLATVVGGDVRHDVGIG